VINPHRTVTQRPAQRQEGSELESPERPFMILTGYQAHPPMSPLIGGTAELDQVRVDDQSTDVPLANLRQAVGKIR
jgi:hypothetical protein